MSMMSMRRLPFMLIGCLMIGKPYAYIAPNPIVVKGIYTVDSCENQMTRELI